MFAKMLVFLLIMLSIQQAKSCEPKQQPILRKTALKDCTKTFTNRIASFESVRYPGYWMYPYKYSTYYNPYPHKSPPIQSPYIGSTSTALVKADKTYHWFLHVCGSGKVCMEAKRNGWEDYYIDNRRTMFVEVVKDTNLYAGSNHWKEMEIWCTSCTPERDDLTYSDCQLIYTDYGGEREALRPNRGNSDVIKKKQGSADYFKWRILSPQTRQYWETTTAGYNCDGLHGLPVSHTVTSSITRTTSTTETTEVNAKISLGLEAAKVLKLLGGEAEIPYSWSFSSTRAAAEGRSITLNKVVKPGYKWIVKQRVGEVGYTKIKPLAFTYTLVKCT